MLFKRRHKKTGTSPEDYSDLNEVYVKAPESPNQPRGLRRLSEDDARFGPKTQEEIIAAARSVN